MRHFVFLKFKDGYFDSAVFNYISETFNKLQSVIPQEIKACRVSKNCVDRAQNMELMIEMQLKDRGSLDKYLKHPLHMAIGERMNSHLASIFSFDCEE